MLSSLLVRTSYSAVTCLEAMLTVASLIFVDLFFDRYSNKVMMYLRIFLIACVAFGLVQSYQGKQIALFRTRVGCTLLC